MWSKGIVFPFQVGKLKFHACKVRFSPLPCLRQKGPKLVPPNIKSMTTPMYGEVEIFIKSKFLIIHNLFFLKDHNGWTPLHFAAENGHFEVCKLIIENVRDKNPGDYKGITPLHLAAENGQIELCELILDNSQEKNPMDKDGWTPLQLANDNGHRQIRDMIFKNMKEKNQRDHKGSTLLHSAARYLLIC